MRTIPIYIQTKDIERQNFNKLECHTFFIMGENRIKNRLIDKIARIIFWMSFLILVAISLVPLENRIKYILHTI